MKKLFFVFALAAMLISCKKSTETRTAEFVKMYNNTSDMMVRSAGFKSTKATTTPTGDVDIEIKTTYLDNDMEAELMKNAIPDIIGQAIQAEPSGKELLAEGVKFNLKVYSSNGTMMSAQTIDKTTKKGNIDLEAIAKGDTPNSSQLNEILKVFSKSLPIVDKASGVKIVAINADAENNIIYSAEVPDQYAEVLAADAAAQIMKDEMMRSPDVRQIFSQTAALGVNNIKYIYKDKTGKKLNEITIKRTDLK
ncbi:hypothetical protein ASG31_11115 [Chryseobacterium sp. Leaf404]|uniref:hypothetical protein n=1 Tax=unclassified Chryseobacterium TaxID=2593645 RepID=UPI0007013488|nr:MULTISPECIES: hypothetical protein [unclassified Chryseobacterium]KQT16914.1 hypothetical protein ASG31_11115 [Chryseobacterium sp. Leaf404]